MSERSPTVIQIARSEDAGRRRFLKLMAASAALASAACKGPPAEKILPYVNMPERDVPGQPTFYASAFVRRGYAHGVVVETNGGRPTKVEGNPDHPVGAGATDVFAQASILQMWDPDRSPIVYQTTEYGEEPSTWQAFEAALEARRARFAADGGAGLRIVTGPSTSPTLARQLDALVTQYPNARWIAYDPLHDDGAQEAARLAFGRPVDPVYRLDQVAVLLTLDADPFGTGPASIANARGFTATRRLGANVGANRLYAMESNPSLTGAYADERLARTPQAIEAALWRIAARLGVTTDAAAAAAAALVDPDDARWEATVAKALAAAPGRALVIAGPTLSPASRALVHLVNEKLGARGGPVDYIAPVLLGAPDHGAALAGLVDEMRAGRVDSLFVLDANPVYTAPADLRFAEALKRVPFSVHAGVYRDETAHAVGWHVPLAHNYEDWSDARAHDGTISIVQPMIAPLYEGRSIHAVLAMLQQADTRDAHAIVRATWGAALSTVADAGTQDAQRKAAGLDAGASPPPGAGPDFDPKWQDALRRGLVADTAAPILDVRATGAVPARPAAIAAPLVAVFAPDPAVDGGEFSNSGWLQELPRPLSSLTWDNAVLIGPRTAERAALKTGDRVRLSLILAAGQGGVSDPVHDVVAPVLVMDAHAEGALTLPLGYGRTRAGGVGNGVGFDAYRLRTRAGRAGPVAVKMERAAGRHELVLRQKEVDMHDRDPVHVSELATVQGTLAAGEGARAGHKLPQPSMYPEPPVDHDNYRWGMAIDLNACIGCAACTIACQAENNIPVVGKDEVAKGRSMHWIRVDRYQASAKTGPRGGRTLFQPVPCMHCEHAPCEEVCPVGATVHDDEGLNVQVYNRCVGTRFCSNNCPYKVRRFNFLQYSNQTVESLKALQNPEVTVRRRGVMEKCTFCLQRITRARIDAEKRGTRLQDGEMVTACQQVCPTRAIRFGDLNDPKADVVAAKAAPLDYVLLEELNTRPRTSYTTRVLNTDPELG